MMNTAYEQAATFIQQQTTLQPQVGLILGSGLGVLADEIEQAIEIAYEDIPGFPVSTVQGHAGKLVIGALEGKVVIAMKGRFHFYEGYDLDLVTLPVRVMRKLGVQQIIVTNAAGGIDEDFKPGDLMLIENHINFTGQNPLIGANDDELGDRFPDMSTAYDSSLRALAERQALKQGIQIRKGVYVGTTGPSYETPAEIRMFRMMGADAVGMSTVPEVIVAVHAGMKVLGISCISNMAAGILDQPLSHHEVMGTARKVQDQFLALVKSVLSEMNV